MTDPARRGRLRVEGELGWLRRVLVCSPGEELRRVPPGERDRYLVEDILWLERAQEQHAAFVRALQILMAAAPSAGVGAPAPEVVDLRAALRVALGDASAEVAADELLEEVCRLEPNLDGAELDEELASLRGRLRAGGEGVGDALLAGVLAEHPAPGRELFRVCPSPNVIFARDYQFVLGGGAFLSSMAKHARAKEPAIARFVFEHALGLPDVSLDVHALARGARAKRRLEGVPGLLSIEGGDVMALGRGTILVGISERTTWRGATALALGLRWLRQRDPAAFPFTELCAVELPPKRAMMHLDTVFTLVDHGLALAYPPLTFPGAREEMPVSACDLTCDPEAPATFRYEGPFADALAPRLSSPGRPLTMIAGGGDRLRFQHREQWCDACNAFAVGPGVAVSYDRNDRTLASLRALDTRGDGGALVATPGRARAPAEHLRPFQVIAAAELTASKAKAVVDAGERVMVCIEGGELGRARGGPHCMTMALVRDAEA